MESLQQALVVLFVLGLLGGTLYWVRRRLPGSTGLAGFSFQGPSRAKVSRMQSIDRLPLTPQHSLHLVRIAGQVLLIAVSPGGCSVVDGCRWEVGKDEGTLLR